MLGFDIKKIGSILSEPWERQVAAEEEQLKSHGFIFQGGQNTDSINQMELNEHSGYFFDGKKIIESQLDEDDQSYEEVERDPFRDTQIKIQNEDGPRNMFGRVNILSRLDKTDTNMSVTQEGDGDRQQRSSAIKVSNDE